jgi:hypothetical protein
MLFSPAQLQALEHIVQQAIQTSIALLNTPTARTRTPAVNHATVEHTTPMTTISTVTTNSSY